MAFLSISVSLGHSNENLQQQEDELRREFQTTKSGQDLLHLALFRERHGKEQEAIATWALARKLWGKQQMPRRSSAPTQSWDVTAGFFIQRLQRKINLRNDKSVQSRQQAQQLQRQLAAAAMSFADSAFVDQLDLAVQADLDGDRIDEIFYIGKSGPLGKRTKKLMGIARWNGKEYRVVWRTEKAVPFMVHVTDEDGDGWKEIFCGYEPDTDNAATLYFNGQTALFL